MGCQRSYLMITVLSKKKQKNWGSKIKRIEKEMDVDIKYFKSHKSRYFQFPLPATNKQKNLKPVNLKLIFLVTETYPFAHEEIRHSYRKDCCKRQITQFSREI